MIMLPKMLKFKDFRPSQSICIWVTANGYRLDVGCKNFVFPDLDDLMAQINWYLKGELTTFTSQFKEELRMIGEDNDAPQTREAPLRGIPGGQ